MDRRVIVQGPRGLSITTQNTTLARLDLCTPKVAVEAEGRGQRQAKEQKQQLIELWPRFSRPSLELPFPPRQPSFYGADTDA